jgi:superfamily II RNA helicase
MEKSLYNRDLINEQTEFKKQLSTIETKLTTYSPSFAICKEYDECMLNTNLYGIGLSQAIIKYNKKRMNEIRQTPNFQNLYNNYTSWMDINTQYTNLTNNLNKSLQHTQLQINNVLTLLEEHGYITNTQSPITKEHITLKGIILSNVQECNAIIFAELLSSNQIDDLDANELAAILSMFSDSKPLDKSLLEVDDENIPENLYPIIEFIENLSQTWEINLDNKLIHTHMDWKVNRYIVGAVYKWMNGDSISEIVDYYDIFEGNFIKDMLKIYNIAGDVRDMAKLLGKNKLSIEANKIVENILRDIVNAESIYIQS